MTRPWFIAALTALALCTLSARAAERNLLENGDFENGASGWTAYGQPSAPPIAMSSEAFSGQKAIVIKVGQAASAGLQSGWITLNQDQATPLLITVAANRAAMKGEQKGSQFAATMVVRYADGTSKWESPASGCFDPSESGWQRVSFVWTPPKPVESLMLRLSSHHSDDVAFDAAGVVELTPALISKAGDLPGGAKVLSMTESFSGNMLPDYLTEHIGTWASRDGALTSVGEIPECGSYLRSTFQYRFNEIAFKVRKDQPNGIVCLHLRRWQIMMQSDQLLITNVQKPDWYLSYARPITFTEGRWHDVRLVFGGDKLDVFWDGKSLGQWRSPAEEFSGRPYADTLRDLKLNFAEFDEILVLHPYQTHAAFDDLTIKGVQSGPAIGFSPNLKYPDPGKWIKDNQFTRLAPREPVAVDWRLTGEPAPQQTLPAVDNFVLTQFDSYDRPNAPQVVDYCVGVDPQEKVPNGVYLYRNRAKPQTLRLYFNLAKEGVYTLKLSLTNMKNLANILEIGVDGKVLSREVYRGENSASVIGQEGVLDYLPLKLAAGLHRIDLHLSEEIPDKLDKGTFWKRLSIGWDRIELSPGHQRPEWMLSPKNAQPAAALEQAPQDTEWFGKEIRARVADLPDGPCMVRLGFRELVLDKIGERVMDIAINGQTVAADFDIVKEAGGDLKYITRDFPARVQNGSVLVELIGKNFHACLNYLEISRDQQVLFRHNAGWAPHVANWGYYARTNKNVNDQPIPADPADNARATNLFAGHNLIANPSFSLSEKDAKDTRPLAWRSALDMKAQNDPTFQASLGDYKIDEGMAPADYARDLKIYHSAPAALRVGQTQGLANIAGQNMWIDYHKRYEFSAFARSENATGTARLALYFWAEDYYNKKLGLSRRLLGRAVSDASISGTTDWQKLSVSAKPPFGAASVTMVLQVQDNTAGSFWLDDCVLDGYGAEPLEITASHLGLHPQGNKSFLVKALSDASVQYVIAGADGKPVLSGTAEKLGAYRFPDRYFYRIDASKLTAAGAYQLQVRQGASSAAHSFSMDGAIYRQLAELMLQGLTIQQLNADVPGYHGPRILDDYIQQELLFGRFDWMIKATGRSRNLMGGFHDAGDRIHHWDLVPSLIFGAMSSADDLQRVSPELARQGRQLMLVGLDNLASAQADDGHFFFADKPYEYDNIPLYGIERYVRGRNALPQAIGIFARAAWQLKDSDAARSRRYLDVAKRVYAATEYSWNTVSLPQNLSVPFNQLQITPKMLLGDLYLHKLTGDAKYARDLEARVVTLCDLLEKRVYLEPGYRNTAEMTGLRYGVSINFDFLWGANFFLEDQPNHAAAERLKKALLVFVKDVERVSAIEPWGQAMDLEKESARPARWPSQFSHSYWTMMSAGLAKLGMLLDRPDIVMLAERQMQWVLGNNPFDLCTITGVGDRYPAVGEMMYLEPEYYLNQINSGRKLWTIPGVVSKSAFRNWGGPNGQMHPPGFSYMLVTPDYPTDPGQCEYWQPMTGNALTASAALAEAMDWMAQRRSTAAEGSKR